MKTSLAVAAALVGALAIGACSSGNATPGSAPATASTTNERLRVVTTVAPITSIAASIAGDLADVAGVIPEGSDSHTYEPPPSTAKVLSQADIVFVNGLKLEDPTKDLAKQNARKSAEIVELGTKTIAPAEYIYDFSFPKSGGKPNPHLWTNPPYAKQYARIIADTLERRDAKNGAGYEANYTAFAAKVDALDAAMITATATLSPSQRELLTYHDAYAYFALHYGWKVIGAIQVSNYEEPTPKEVAALIQQIRKEKVPAIFGSEVFPSPVLAQIGKETGVRYVDTLRDDDLPGAPGDPDHSWFGLMRFDFVTMVKNLGGDASALNALVVSPMPDHATYPQ